MKKFLIWGIAPLVLLVIGATVGSMITTSNLSPSASNTIAPDAMVGKSSGGMMDMGSAATTSTDQLMRSVIQTASLSLQTKNVTEAASNAKRTVEGYSGIVDNWSQQANDAGQVWSVSATVRVPADKLNAALADLGKLGKVTAQDINKSDVTSQVVDIDARVTALKASVSRLLKLVAKAKTTADLISAEEALSQRQAELQSLEQQQKYLKDQVVMSTIWLQLFAEGLGPVAEPTNFADGLAQGWVTLLKFGVLAIVAAGWIVPWLIIIVPMAAIGWLISFLIRRRRKK